MRTSHQSSTLQVVSTTPRRLHLQGVLQLQARHAGWLRVDSGRVWITRSGDAGDHVLAGGEAIALNRGQALLLEPWRVGEAASLRWDVGRGAASGDQPVDRPPVLRRRPAAGPWRNAAGAAWLAWARALRGAAGRLAAAARSAEAMASRAQGSISAGDSIASSGALQ